MNRETQRGSTAWTSARLEILDAAAQAFMNRGYSATSLNDIADSLGATKGRIYHYYRSKGAVFLDVLSRVTRILCEEVEPIAHDESVHPRVRIHQMARKHMRITMENYAYFRVTAGGVLDMSVAGSDLRTKSSTLDQYIELRDSYEDLYADVVAEGTEAGEFRPIPPRLASKAILGALNWTTMWYRPTSERAMSEEIVDEFATFVVVGLLPQSLVGPGS